MRRFLVSLFITTLFSYLQTTLLSGLSWTVFKVTPDISLIFLIFFSITFGRSSGIMTGFSSGLLEDMLSISPLGFYAFVKMILGSVFGSLKSKVYLESLPIALILVSLGTLVKYIVAAVTNMIAGIGTLSVSVFSQIFIFELIVNNLLAIPCYYFFQFLVKKLSRFWQYEGESHEQF
jgi:rod shape-determining protein MreD